MPVQLHDGGEPAAVADPATASTGIEESTESPSSLLQDIATYQELIQQTLTEDGLYAEGLRQQYQAMAMLESELGQHNKAVETLEKAIHIARVNDGLFTERQIDDIQRIIANLQIMGDTKRETEYRGYLYYVQRRTFAEGSPERLDATVAFAEWNLETYLNSFHHKPFSILLDGRDTPQDFMVLRDTATGEMLFAPANLMSNSAGRVALPPELMLDRRVKEARRAYEEILEGDTSAFTPAQLQELRLKLAATHFTIKTHLDLLVEGFSSSSIERITPIGPKRDSSIVVRGRNAGLLLLEANIEASRHDPLALAQAYLDLADYQLAYNNQKAAVSVYKQAWDALAETTLSDAEKMSLMKPVPFIPVPAFADHPFSPVHFTKYADDSLDYRGYIDMSFNITIYGELRAVTVNATSDDTPWEVRRQLIEYLRFLTARPAFSEGTVSEINDLQYRFYYDY